MSSPSRLVPVLVLLAACSTWGLSYPLTAALLLGGGLIVVANLVLQLSIRRQSIRSQS